MTQPAKVQEPSMEEILASIRRIIADDETKPDASKPAEATAKPAPSPAKPEVAVKPSVAAKPPVVSNSQADIDAMLAGFDAPAPAAPAPPPAAVAPPVAKPAAAPPPPAVPPAPAAAEDVFDLTDDMAIAMEKPSAFKTVDPKDDLEFDGAAAAQPPHRSAGPQEMLSKSTVSAVESAFNSLANTVLENNARTLEDLVKEMLRPMLKNWLDNNLPTMVERIVKAEIERVSRRG
jgi:cell pole-organizing protein PopZ